MRLVFESWRPAFAVLAAAPWSEPGDAAVRLRPRRHQNASATTFVQLPMSFCSTSFFNL